MTNIQMLAQSCHKNPVKRVAKLTSLGVDYDKFMNSLSHISCSCQVIFRFLI
jgi:hypothetical protein